MHISQGDIVALLCLTLVGFKITQCHFGGVVIHASLFKGLYRGYGRSVGLWPFSLCTTGDPIANLLCQTMVRLCLLCSKCREAVVAGLEKIASTLQSLLGLGEFLSGTDLSLAGLIQCCLQITAIWTRWRFHDTWN